jgi:hypothetical protein
LLQVIPADAPDWPTLRERVGHIRSYFFDHYAMAEPSSAKTGEELSSNGGNLAAVLGGLCRRAPVEFAALVAEGVRLWPEYAGLEVAESAGGVVEFSMRLVDGGLVSAENLSQGTLYVLAMLAIAFDPDPPAVLCIEEIDRGIHPRLLREERETRPDIAILAVDRSDSTQIADRAERIAAARAAFEARAARLPALDLRVVEVPEAGQRGTALFSALGAALADVPRARLAGVIALTDGQVHDAPALLPFDAPFHVLLPGRPGEVDRRLRLVSAPGFGIVGRSKGASFLIGAGANG